MSRLQFLSLFALGLLPASLVAPLPAQVSRVSEIEAFVDRAFALGATPGLGVAVILEGKLVLDRGYGYTDATARRRADQRSYWYLASTSKSLTGFALALLAQEDSLDLAAPITELLPEARWHRDAKVDDLTAISFLAHTHGLNAGAVVQSAAYTGVFEESSFPELLQYSAPLDSRELRYSNLGYNVASMIIDSRRSEKWKAYLDRRVLRPAGMRETHSTLSGLDRRRVAMPHDWSPDGAFVTRPLAKRDRTLNAAGGHFATTGDMARWILVHMDGGLLNGKRVFPAELVERTHGILARHTNPEQRFAFFNREGWGYGWDIGSYEGDRMISRFGSYHSYRSHVSYLPDRRAGVVVMVNGQTGSPLTDIIAAYVYDLAAGRPDAEARGDARLKELAGRLEQAKQGARADRERRAGRQRPLPRPLKDYAGTYEHPGYGRMTWKEKDGALEMTWGVLEAVAEVYNADKNQLRVELAGSGSVVEFKFEASGPATGLKIGDIDMARSGDQR
jgi:CubicO group peptidase (beta-lactamase class C family)